MKRKINLRILSFFLCLVMMAAFFPANHAAASTIINSASVIISAPVAGNHPSYNTSLNSQEYYSAADGNEVTRLNDMYWYDVTADQYMIIDKDTFLGGHQYRAEVYLTPSDGYQFNPSASGKINNYTAETMKAANGKFQLTYTFPALPPAVSSVSAEVREPRIGNHEPDFDPILPSSALYRICDFNNSSFTQGVAWRDEDHHYLEYDSYYRFEAEKEYTIEIMLEPGSGYVFDANTAGQINRKSASVALSNGKLLLSYTFKMPIALDSGYISITKPVIGEYPDFHPTVPSDAHYTCSSIIWYETSGDSYTVLTEGKETFRENQIYTIDFVLTPDNGYSFDPDNPSGRVNYHRTNTASIQDNGNLCVYYCFGTLTAPITHAAITTTTPMAGAKPDYSPGRPSDAHFYCDNSYPNDTSINNVSWFDQTAERWMKTTDTFTAGHVYSFRVDLTPQSNYEFSPSFTATVNGNTAQTQLRDSEDGDYMRVSYTFPAAGVAQGWQNIDGKWYFYKDNEAVTGWYKDGSKWYYFDGSGVMQSGWIQLGGKWYYLGNEMKTGWQKISNKWYYFNSNGVMQSGWIKLGGKWYYLGNEMKTGWQKISNKWYCFNSDGVMQSGWIQLGGKWYYLGNEMKTGWQKISNEWYYFDSNGVMQSGWIQLGGKWYYLDNGAMVIGTKVIDGKTYIFNSNGVWQQ